MAKDKRPQHTRADPACHSFPEVDQGHGGGHSSGSVREAARAHLEMTLAMLCSQSLVL